MREHSACSRLWLSIRAIDDHDREPRSLPPSSQATCISGAAVTSGLSQTRTGRRLEQLCHRRAILRKTAQARLNMSLRPIARQLVAPGGNDFDSSWRRTGCASGARQAGSFAPTPRSQDASWRLHSEVREWRPNGDRGEQRRRPQRQENYHISFEAGWRAASRRRQANSRLTFSPLRLE